MTIAPLHGCRGVDATSVRRALLSPRHLGVGVAHDRGLLCCHVGLGTFPALLDLALLQYRDPAQGRHGISMLAIDRDDAPRYTRVNGRHGGRRSCRIRMERGGTLMLRTTIVPWAYRRWVRGLEAMLLLGLVAWPLIWVEAQAHAGTEGRRTGHRPSGHGCRGRFSGKTLEDECPHMRWEQRQIGRASCRERVSTRV